MEFVHFVFSSFWVWLGFVIIFYIPVELIFKVINRFIRRSNIKNKGWPPAHLDADGDWKPDKEKESE